MDGRTPDTVPPPERIVLIGYRGSGKTTVGRTLAERLGWSFLDADEVLVEAAGRTIAEIFAAEGEAAFRDVEERTLAGLLARTSVVVATGGGVVTREANRRRLAAEPAVVFLRASVPTLAARLAGDGRTAAMRPALTGLPAAEEIARLLAERTPHYEALAKLTLDADHRSADDIAAEMTRRFDLRLSPG